MKGEGPSPSKIAAEEITQFIEGTQKVKRRGGRSKGLCDVKKKEK